MEGKIEVWLNEISEEQAVDSEEGGDSDAEDHVQYSGNRSSLNSQNRPCDTTEGSPHPSASCSREKRNGIDTLVSSPDSSNELSDDLADDPDYAPESPRANNRSLRFPVVISESDSSVSDTDNARAGLPDNVSNMEVQDYSWSKSSNSPQKFSSSYFSRTSGSKQNINSSSPIAYLNMILTVTFLNHIVEQSNLYASQNGNQLELHLDELKAFVGILIFMGFHTLPSMRLFWSTDENFHVERIARVMSLKRFLKILRYLHLNDNSKMPSRGSPNFDKLYKIRPLIEHLQDTFPKLFAPSRFLSIDESMIAFKGRSCLKQYMPLKPIKRGFKVWVCCSALTGYMLAFDVYTGKKDDGQVTHSLGERIVSFLCKGFEGLFYCVFFDNFFSSIPLLVNLWRKGVFACGTLRPNRKYYPKEMFKRDNLFSKNEIDFVQCNDITITKWKDHGKKPVTLVSNMHDPSIKTKVLRKDCHGVREEVDCPQSVADYNKYMGGVDKFDQYMAAYSIAMKSRRWWLKIFYYFLDCMIVNSYIVFKAELKEKKLKSMSHLKFRSQLVNELIQSFSSKKRPGYSPANGRGRKRNRSDGQATIENTVRLSDVGSHLPELIKTYRRCAQCSTKQKEKRSNMICKKCNVALCKSCFEPFHKS